MNAKILDFQRERLKRLLERELEKWIGDIEEMTPDELERQLRALEDGLISKHGVKPEKEGAIRMTTPRKPN